jgi:hypothetical protein
MGVVNRREGGGNPLTVALFGELARNVAVKRASRSRNELRHSEQAVSRDRYSLPGDGFVAVDQRIRVASDIEDGELAGLGDEPPFLEYSGVKAFD